MPISSRVSLTPQEPHKFLWDETNLRYSYIAKIRHYGVTLTTGMYDLQSQYEDNRVRLGSNHLPYPFPDTLTTYYFDHALVRLKRPILKSEE